MAFRPILDASDLPSLGAKREDLTCDFKATVATWTPARLAEAVAAFANGSGGTILIGATEDPSTNALQGWVPLTEQEAKTMRDAVNNAVVARCAPPPVIEPVVLDRGGGEFAVAVNVWSYPLLPVGVSVQSEPTEWTNDSKKPQIKAWVFPVRVGVETKHFTPEHAAMLMLPSVRRILALLDSVPDGSSLIAHYTIPNPNPGGSLQHFKVMLKKKSVEPLSNVATFQIEIGGVVATASNQFSVGTTLEVPLDEIETLWREQGGWRLKLRGYLSPQNKHLATGTVTLAAYNFQGSSPG